MLYFIVFISIVILIYVVNQKSSESKIPRGTSKSIRNVRTKLIKGYGKSKFYSEGQIERVTKELGVATYSIPFVFAYFSSKEGWLEWKKSHEESYNWDRELSDITDQLNDSDLSTLGVESGASFEGSGSDFSSDSEGDFGGGGDSSGY